MKTESILGYSQSLTRMILCPEADWEADLACAYGLDLRRRVIAVIEDGHSTRGVARRFSIGISTAGSWYRQWLAMGEARPLRQGHPPGSKLDSHAAFILGLVGSCKDITLREIAEELERRHGVRASEATVCRFLAKRGLTFKKRRRTRQSSNARMSSRAPTLVQRPDRPRA